ncbi:MAG: hypothetical protein QOH63_3124 [Acidobacteriota bacterium]|nr:hypothetical protein [Acidobacteriota bacterium]
MSEPAIQYALKLFEDQARKRRPPNLAVLGPSGSGKSHYLSNLLTTLNNSETSPRKHCLMLDLRDIPVGSQDEIYFHINRMLLQEAVKNDIPREFDIVVQPAPLRFEEILSRLLKSVEGYLIIFIDHLDSVPRLFASDLSHRFRNFLEETDADSEYKRLGLVVSGAVSLYELKHGPNSAFQMLPIVSFPQTDHEIRCDMVESYLKNFMSSEIPKDLIDLLAELTGGEPGFLGPLVLNLLKGGRQISLSQELICVAVEEICSYSQTPVLRNLALHLWGDKMLREIVRDLNTLPIVTPRSILPDIDRYQLSGAVFVRRILHSKTSTYEFRNKITADFMTRIYRELEGPRDAIQARISILDELDELEAIKSNCLESRQIWKWTKTLRDAWAALTPYSLPNMFLYVTKRDADYGWWLDANAKRVFGPELREETSASTKLAAFSALENMPLTFSGDAENLRAFIESDDDQISVGLPLSARDVTVILIATLPRTDAGRGLTEFDLCHWIRFVQNVKHVAPIMALAEIGQKWVHDPLHEVNATQPAPTAATIAVQTAGKTQVTQICLMPKGEVLVRDGHGVTIFSGMIDGEIADDLNNRCLKMITHGGDYGSFEEELKGIAIQLAAMLSKELPDLREHLTPSVQKRVVIATDKEGLRVPFELYPLEKSHLSMLTPISRQIINYRLPPDVCQPFHQLLSSLAADGKELRVLLVASDVGGKLSQATEELQQVRNHIESGCLRIGLKPDFVEILPEAATISRLETELLEQRPYHIFHFTGHAMHFTEDQNASGILLHGEDGPEVVPCKRLKRWLEGAGLWLTYLSSCHSSAVSGKVRGLSEKYLGTIDAAISAGVPNVVGFRWLVSDRSAFHLATEFYRQLFEVQKDMNISVAMHNARRSVERRTDFFDAWASSILVTQYL